MKKNSTFNISEQYPRTDYVKTIRFMVELIDVIKMGVVTVNIFPIGHKVTKPIKNAIYFLNNLQDAFLFELYSDKKSIGYSRESYKTFELYADILPERKQDTDPFIVGIVEKRLEGKNLHNLFGSMEDIDNRLTGKAITSYYGINQILKKIPLEIYFILELLSFSIRFVVGKGMIHKETRDCMFDVKLNKYEIIKALKFGDLCEVCLDKVSNALTRDQWYTIRQTVNEISSIARSSDPARTFKQQMEIITREVTTQDISSSIKTKKYLHIVLQTDTYPTERFDRIDLSQRRNEIFIKISIFCEDPKELKNLLRRIIKSDWPDVKKDAYAGAIKVLLSDWKVLKPGKWKRVQNALFSLAGKILTDEIADIAKDSLTEGFRDLFHWVRQNTPI